MTRTRPWISFLCCALAASMAARAEEHRIAIHRIEVRSGALDPASAASLEEELRAAVREIGSPNGLRVIESSREAETGPGVAPVDRARALGASHFISGRAARMEGALAVTLALVRSDTGERLAEVRLVGLNRAELRREVRPKLAVLLRPLLRQPESSAPPVALREPAKAAPVPGSRLPTPTATTAPTRIANPTATATATATTTSADDSPLIQTIREVTAEVEALRGLRRKSNLKVELLSDGLFSKALREKVQKELTPAVVAAERARWVAFGLAPASADPASILLGVLDEQVAGFYDPYTKALTVREKVPASASAIGPDGLLLVLAHEIEHALQDQNFGFPDMAALGDDDARLARMSLYEGDAMAVMMAYAARRAHKPVKLSLLAGATALRSATAQQLLQMSGYSPALLSAPAILREELAFPYVSGFALVAEVYRRGGFALVDRMFKNPPATTHQVLHPDRYFAGEEAARIDPPPVPAGLRVLASGRMGELGARIALAVCLEPQAAKDFAESWAGDAYTIARDGAGSLALVWRTAWSGEGARVFANAIDMQKPCWESSERSAGPAQRPAPSISGTYRWKSSDTTVTVVRGLRGGAFDSTLASASVFSAAAAPSHPPLGDLPAPLAETPGRVEEGRFQSPRLALLAEVPQGFDTDVQSGAAELILRRQKQPPALATLLFVPEPLAAETAEDSFQSLAATAATQLGGSSLRARTERNVKLLGAAAKEISWDVDGTPAQVRITLAPACAGKAFYAVVRATADEFGRAAVDRFVDSLRATSAETSPACAELE